MITLCMIVRNEAATLAQTLESARRALGARLGGTLLLDTGSTDGTLEVAREWARHTYVHDRDLMIEQRPFDDFASSRNHALAHAWAAFPGRPALMLDAGTIVRGTLTHTEGPATVECRLGATRWARPQVLVPGWYYVGKVHEYATGPGVGGPLKRSGLIVDYCLRDPARAERWKRDLALLTGDDPRTIFYRAQTYELLGRWREAEREYVARMGIEEGYGQERVVSALRCLRACPSDERAELYAALVRKLDSTRWHEARVYLAERAIRRCDWEDAYHHASSAIAIAPRPGADALFPDLDAEWKAYSYASEALMHTPGAEHLAEEYAAMALRLRMSATR